MRKRHYVVVLPDVSSSVSERRYVGERRQKKNIKYPLSLLQPSLPPLHNPCLIYLLSLFFRDSTLWSFKNSNKKLKFRSV
jgi:hypothetical protein